ncbi:MAG: hypothetical protein KKF62_16420 [Bacteroidetes bacterium]|nr:hypothetical protein [Bacteroidota bacterium]MBU1117264.1 hypothetical protein [Bacteroidota bacterium]MBU1800070.1 hypothetical protein [Bacteroidota bacterium]
MAKKKSRRRIEYHRFKDFKQVAISFYEGAKIAQEFDYQQAAGLLIIHSAIAFADAITVKLRSEKCTGENHYEIINLLEETVPQSKERDQSIKHFKILIDHKNLVSYTGDIYYKKDVDKLLKHFERFFNWANTILEQ